MSVYAKADTKTQWFADNFRGSTMRPNCGCLHTTEGTDWPGYDGGAVAPNLTAKPDFERMRLVWRQHYPDEMSARALQNDAGGVETNTANVVQVELVGTCAPGSRDEWKRRGLKQDVDFIFWPEAPEWALHDLAAFIADYAQRHGIKVHGPDKWLPYPASYGQSNANRMTFGQWHTFYGWCGHQHVPENDHGDPGALPWLKIAEYAQAIIDPPPPPKPPAVTFRAAHISGRWDAPPDSWRKALAIVAKDGASVATITETTRDGVLGGVLPDGWELARLDATPGQSECAVAWDADVWHAASDAYAAQVATTTFEIHGHERPPTTTICQPLTHKESGKVALFQALHAPSGVEGPGTFKGRRPGAVEAYQQTADGVRKAWGVGWGRHPQAARVIGADHNVSFRRRWVRDWWATTFPELQSCWEKHRPILGTHGLRVIDGISVGRGKLNVTHARVLTRRAPKFDHRHVVVDVEWLP